MYLILEIVIGVIRVGATEFLAKVLVAGGVFIEDFYGSSIAFVVVGEVKVVGVIEDCVFIVIYG